MGLSMRLPRFSHSSPPKFSVSAKIFNSRLAGGGPVRLRSGQVRATCTDRSPHWAHYSIANGSCDGGSERYQARRRDWEYSLGSLAAVAAVETTRSGDCLVFCYWLPT